MNTRQALKTIRRLPLFPLIPLVPLALVGTCMGLIAANHRRLRRIEQRIDETWPPTRARAEPALARSSAEPTTH